MKLLAALLTITTASGAWPLDGWAQQPPDGGDPATIAAVEKTLVDVIARAEPSVVAIARIAPPRPSLLVPRIEDMFGDLRQQPGAADQPFITAAGVIIDPAGLVLTEYLAVREGDLHTVTTVDGRTYTATIKAADPRSGLAVLALASPLQRAGNAANQNQPSVPAIPLGDAAQLRKGQFVIAIGNPYAIHSDGEPTAGWGTVTNLARKAPAGANLNDTPGPLGDYKTTLHHLGTLIQTDAKLGWSAGGGALVNLRGELVGLTTTVAAIAGHEQPAGYAIPIDDALRRIIDTLNEGREVEYGLLGVSFRQNESLLEASNQRGVTIQHVYAGSPAASAGLRAEDVITEVSGRPVRDIDSVQLAVGIHPPGHSITIGYTRGDRDVATTATLAKLAVPGHKIVTDRPASWRGLRVDYATALDAPTLAEQSDSGALDPDGCVLVAEVQSDSAAWRAGVRAGMFISHVGRNRVTTPQEFRVASESQAGAVTVRLTQPVRQTNQNAPAELTIPPPE